MTNKRICAHSWLKEQPVQIGVKRGAVLTPVLRKGCTPPKHPALWQSVEVHSASFAIVFDPCGSEEYRHHAHMVSHPLSGRARTHSLALVTDRWFETAASAHLTKYSFIR